MALLPAVACIHLLHSPLAFCVDETKERTSFRYYLTLVQGCESIELLYTWLEVNNRPKLMGLVSHLRGMTMLLTEMLFAGLPSQGRQLLFSLHRAECSYSRERSAVSFPWLLMTFILNRSSGVCLDLPRYFIISQCVLLVIISINKEIKFPFLRTNSQFL